MKPHLRFNARPKPKPLSHNHIDTITLSDGINGNQQRKTAEFRPNFPLLLAAPQLYLTLQKRAVW